MTEVFTLIGAVVSIGALGMLIVLLAMALRDAVTIIRRR